MGDRYKVGGGAKVGAGLNVETPVTDGGRVLPAVCGNATFRSLDEIFDIGLCYDRVSNDAKITTLADDGDSTSTAYDTDHFTAAWGRFEVTDHSSYSTFDGSTNKLGLGFWGYDNSTRCLDSTCGGEDSGLSVVFGHEKTKGILLDFDGGYASAGLWVAQRATIPVGDDPMLMPGSNLEIGGGVLFNVVFIGKSGVPTKYGAPDTADAVFIFSKDAIVLSEIVAEFVSSEGPEAGGNKFVGEALGITGGEVTQETEILPTMLLTKGVITASDISESIEACYAFHSNGSVVCKVRAGLWLGAGAVLAVWAAKTSEGEGSEALKKHAVVAGAKGLGGLWYMLDMDRKWQALGEAAFVIAEWGLGAATESSGINEGAAIHGVSISGSPDRTNKGIVKDERITYTYDINLSNGEGKTGTVSDINRIKLAPETNLHMGWRIMSHVLAPGNAVRRKENVADDKGDPYVDIAVPAVLVPLVLGVGREVGPVEFSGGAQLLQAYSGKFKPGAGGFVTVTADIPLPWKGCSIPVEATLSAGTIFGGEADARASFGVGGRF